MGNVEDGVKIFRDNLFVFNLDPVGFFYEGNEFQHTGGVYDAGLQKRFLLVEARLSIIKKEIVGNEIDYLLFDILFHPNSLIWVIESLGLESLGHRKFIGL